MDEKAIHDKGWTKVFEKEVELSREPNLSSEGKDDILNIIDTRLIDGGPVKSEVGYKLLELLVKSQEQFTEKQLHDISSLLKRISSDGGFKRRSQIAAILSNKAGVSAEWKNGFSTLSRFFSLSFNY